MSAPSSSPAWAQASQDEFDGDESNESQYMDYPSDDTDEEEDEASRNSPTPGDPEEEDNVESNKDEEEEGEEEEEDTPRQVVHKDRYQSDFGKHRIGMNEATISFVRDGWVFLKDKGVTCFKPGGGAWGSGSKFGQGQVWVNNDEMIFKDALLWATGKGRSRSKARYEPKYRDSYEAAILEKSNELERYLDACRTEGGMDAAQMHSNRQARLRIVLLKLPQDLAQKPQPGEAQAVVDAIAGKPVDLAALTARINEPAKSGFGPLPATMQVDPVYLQPGPATNAFMKKDAADWKEKKKAGDKSRRESLRGLASATETE